MRDKIEISTQLLGADVAEMSLWWKRGEQEIGMLELYWKRFQKCGTGQQSIVVSAISTVIIRTAKQMAVAGAFFGVCATML